MREQSVWALSLEAGRARRSGFFELATYYERLADSLQRHGVLSEDLQGAATGRHDIAAAVCGERGAYP